MNWRNEKEIKITKNHVVAYPKIPNHPTRNASLFWRMTFARKSIRQQWNPWMPRIQSRQSLRRNCMPSDCCCTSRYLSLRPDQRASLVTICNRIQLSRITRQIWRNKGIKNKPNAKHNLLFGETCWMRCSQTSASHSYHIALHFHLNAIRYSFSTERKRERSFCFKQVIWYVRIHHNNGWSIQLIPSSQLSLHFIRPFFYITVTSCVYESIVRAHKTVYISHGCSVCAYTHNS